MAVTGANSWHSRLVMAGLVPAIPINLALCHPDRDRRDKPGNDAMSFAPVTNGDARGQVGSHGRPLRAYRGVPGSCRALIVHRRFILPHSRLATRLSEFPRIIAHIRAAAC